MSSFELTPNNTHALQKETLTCELQKEKSGLQHLVVGEVAIERGPWCGARTRLRWPCRHLRCCCAVVVQRIGVGRGRWLEPCVLSCGSAAEDGSREVGDHRGCGADAKLQTELPKTNLKNWRAPHCIGARRGPHFTHRRAASPAGCQRAAPTRLTHCTRTCHKLQGGFTARMTQTGAGSFCPLPMVDGN